MNEREEVPVNERQEVSVNVNGEVLTRSAEPRRLLVDFVREECGLTGTKIGCEDGGCGACTVLLDGEPVRSCLLFAAQADGRELQTVEGLDGDEPLERLRAAFHANHALQCGFCTAGMLLTARELVDAAEPAGEAEVRDALSGVICRCTGYHNIVEAVLSAGDGANHERHDPS